MRQAFVAPDFPALRDQLNRPAARTRTVMTSLDLAVFEATEKTTDPYTAYLHVHWPVEEGMVLRRARFIPGQTVAELSGATYATVTVGLKRGTRFDALGNTYDTRTKAMTEGVPFDLVAFEQRIAPTTGVVVRVVQASFPSASLLGSAVESFFGYEG